MFDQEVVNGVNVYQLANTVDAIRRHPELARFQFRLRNEWQEGAYNVSRIKEFHGGCQEDATRTSAFYYSNDAPEALMGEDHGANPLEFLLHALAGCLTTSLVYHAAARGVEIDEVETRFEGDLDLQGFLGLRPDVRNGYERIRVTFRVKADADPQTIEDLVQLAQQRSPVFDIVTNGVPVDVNCETVSPVLV